MKDKEMKSLIKNEFNTIVAPNRKEELLEDIQFVTQIESESTPKYKMNLRNISIALCVSFVMLFAFLSLNTPNYEYLISLDVNPSIDLQIDKDERVTNVKCHNEDGVIVLDDMDLVGTDIDVAVNAIIGSMFKNGYISEIRNSVLVSVQGKNEEVREEMKQRVVKDIKDTLDTYALESSVISTSFERETKASKLADEYGISIGKAVLIQEFVSTNSHYQFEDLADLSIDELNTLIHFHNTSFTTITIDGIESRDGYLTANELKETVYKHAKVIESEVTDYSYDLQGEHGRLVYNVTFKDNYGTYQYKVNAVSGTVIHFDFDI